MTFSHSQECKNVVIGMKCYFLNCCINFSASSLEVISFDNCASRNSLIIFPTAGLSRIFKISIISLPFKRGGGSVFCSFFNCASSCIRRIVFSKFARSGTPFFGIAAFASANVNCKSVSPGISGLKKYF